MQISHSLVTASPAATQKIASDIAKEFARTPSDHARVIALSGNLGAGKTTFTQGFAKALGIMRPVQSPTFVIMKIYELNKKYLKHLVHIDAYRIETVEELEHLGFLKLLEDKDAVILIEWADRIKKILPEDTMWLYFEHGRGIKERILELKTKSEK